MSFRQLLKKGTLGDLSERVSTQDRGLPAGEAPKGGDQGSAAKSTRVLYITGDPRESRIVTGAFSHSHPHLDFDFSVDFPGSRAYLAQSAANYETLVVGWSVPSEDAFGLIGHVREQGYALGIVAAAEQSLDLYRQAGADECVRKGGSFLARLPIAIEDALKKRPARTPSRSFAPVAVSPSSGASSFSPVTTPVRVAYAGDLQVLHAALEGQTPPLECVPLAETLKESDLQPGAAPPFDIVLIEHSDKTAVAIADVRARNLDVALVLLVEPAEERAAFETFGAGVDEYVAKTADWPTRLQMRLGTARTRYQQTRELASLRVKEARLRSLVDKLPACVVRLSPEGTILASNAVALSLLGATNPAQLLRKQFDVMVTAEDREAWTDFVVRVCAGETRSAEVTITALDGASRVIAATAVPAPSEFGRTPSMFTVLRDVSDRRKLEAAVQHATELVAAAERVAFSEAPAVAAVAPEEEEIALPVAPVVLEAPVPAAIAPDAREDATSAATEIRPLRELEADLHRISGSARATFEELGTLLRGAEAQHDVALARQADEYGKLKAIELEHWRFYEAFVQGSTHGVFRATLTGRILDVNPSLASTLGYESPADVIAVGEYIGALTDESTWSQAVELWRQGPQGAAVETPWRHRNRAPLTLRLRGRVIESPQGDGECLEVIAENITAQRALEMQLRRARKWEDVARITSGIAADLTHVVASVTDSSDVSDMQRAAAKALALSRQLVAFGRREGRDPAALDLNGLVRGLEDVLRRLIDEHIELTLTLAPQLERVEAAQPSVEEALVNLTVAAADALPAGGRIDVETASVEIDRESAERHEGIEPGAYSVLTITATGWGMDAEIRERLQRGRLTQEPTVDEVGRRFSSAARAVGHTGGGLGIDGVAGESLTFRVYLPRVQRVDALERTA
ncbi:MAG TPA: PAS domain S-box protein [Vicinamibacterales bacterium]|nr:PAS domain S-box protein [Vicinamibacterales bacterium]